MPKMNQRDLILSYIDNFGSISPMEAFRYLGISKLATRVSEIICMGTPIKKTVEHGVNRYGEKIHYMRYSREVNDGKTESV